MTRLNCAVLMMAAASMNAFGQVARPHVGSPFALAGSTFETPASLACVYHLVPTLVPGCPVKATTELPSDGEGTIAVVNAYDYPTAAADLATFSTRFHAPQCDAGNPCFEVVYAAGTKPPVDALWSANAAPLIEYAHALAPKAKIVLVEAASGSLTDLMAASDVASSIIASSPSGKGQVMLPFGEFEFVGQTDYDARFTTPGVVYLSSAEGGLNMIEYPAASPNVIAVGATGLLRNPAAATLVEFSTTFFTGGESLYELRPNYQNGIRSIVGAHRGVPDVALAGDPVWGAYLLYDSVNLDGFVGWQYSGSAASAMAVVATIINRAGSGAVSTPTELERLYQNLGNASVFHDITLGQALGVHATKGWDPVTGIGSPIGLAGK